MANLLSVETAAAIMHVCFGLVAFFIGKAAGLTPNVVLLVTVALISNLVSFLFVSIFSLVVANQTFKHGLDPDNFVIPLVTSASDLGATMALMGTIAILGIE
jgi:cation transporter-like permease